MSFLGSIFGGKAGGADKGAFGVIGDFLYGGAGNVDFQPEPFRYGYFPLTDVEKLKPEYTSRDSGRNVALTQLSGAQDRWAPQARRPSDTVQVSGFTPERYSGSRIDTSGFNKQVGNYETGARQAGEMRQRQVADLGLLRSAALGGQPSVAEQQLKEGMDRSIAAQASAAASARGGAGARAAAARRAEIGAADVRADTNRAAGQLRADEMARARGELVAGGQAIRGQDIGQQQTALTAAQTALEPSMTQAQLEQQARMQGIDLTTQSALQRLGLTTQAGLQTQRLGTETALADLQAQLQNRGMNDQYVLGLLGQLGGMDRTALAGSMGYAGALTQQEMDELQLRQQEHIARQQMMAGIAGQNAQAAMTRSGGGGGFLGGLTSMIGL